MLHYVNELHQDNDMYIHTFNTLCRDMQGLF